MHLVHTAHVPSGEGPFPTVIALHGWGASAHDLMGLAPFLAGGEALVLCPQGRVEVAISPTMVGYGWFPLRQGLAPNPDEFLTAAEEIRDFVREAREVYPIDPERTVFLGFSQGGLMAFEQALRDPKDSAGVAALSTWLPEPLAERLPPRSDHEELPVLVIHGTEDPMIPVERARESREALRGYGVRLTYRELEMGHEIRPEALDVLGRWLMEKAFSEE